MARELDTRFRHILRRWVTPALNAHGFVKQGNVYERVGQGLSWVIDVYRNPLKTPHKSDFTLECGIYVPRMMSIYMNRPEPRRVNIGYCCIDVRIGRLAEDGEDIWWDLLPDDDSTIVDRTIGEDLDIRLRADALRFFGRFKTPQDVLRFLEEPRSGQDRFVMPRVEAMSLCYAAILATLLGFRERGATLIKMSLAAGRKNPGLETYQDVAQRLLDFNEFTDGE